MKVVTETCFTVSERIVPGQKYGVLAKKSTQSTGKLMVLLHPMERHCILPVTDREVTGNSIYGFPKKTDNGFWKHPVNCGPVINTPYNDNTPFFDPSSNTLTFSSVGHLGMGRI